MEDKKRRGRPSNIEPLMTCPVTLEKELVKIVKETYPNLSEYLRRLMALDLKYRILERLGIAAERAECQEMEALIQEAEGAPEVMIEKQGDWHFVPQSKALVKRESTALAKQYPLPEPPKKKVPGEAIIQAALRAGLTKQRKSRKGIGLHDEEIRKHRKGRPKGKDKAATDE